MNKRSNDACPRRHWFRFSLRSCFVAMTVFALWLGWQADGAIKQKRLVEAIQQCGGSVRYDFESSANAASHSESPLGALIRRSVGPDFLHNVVEVNFAYRKTNGGNEYNYAHMSDDVVPLLVGLTHIRKLILHYDQATNDSFKLIGTLASLEDLDAGNATSVSDQGIEYISGLPNLKSLEITNAALTDKSLAAVGGLRSLERLRIWAWAAQGTATRFTDNGLMNLASCNKLRTLVLRNTGVSDAGIEMLKAHLPNCSIKGGWDGSWTYSHGKRVPDVSEP